MNSRLISEGCCLFFNSRPQVDKKISTPSSNWSGKNKFVFIFVILQKQVVKLLFLLGGGQTGSGVELEEDDVAVLDGVVAALLAVLAGGLQVGLE